MSGHFTQTKKSVRCHLVTFSDTRDLESDESGQVMERSLSEAGHQIVKREIVTDDPEQIRRCFARIVEEKEIGVVVTSGGTGISRRDHTFEMVEQILEKRLDGFGEIFRFLSFQEIGAHAILSRTLAGVTGNGVMIFALPGSPKAVALAMKKLILPILVHATQLLEDSCGRAGSGVSIV